MTKIEPSFLASKAKREDNGSRGRKESPPPERFRQPEQSMMEEKHSKSTPELLEIVIEQMRGMVRQQTQTNERLDHVADELRTGLAATN
ncbi:MAG: hypothetical protein D6795_20745, partial [Deltaproteobacteria bacterium]